MRAEKRVEARAERRAGSPLRALQGPSVLRAGRRRDGTGRVRGGRSRRLGAQGCAQGPRGGAARLLPHHHPAADHLQREGGRGRGHPGNGPDAERHVVGNLLVARRGLVEPPEAVVHACRAQHCGGGGVGWGGGG